MTDISIPITSGKCIFGVSTFRHKHFFAWPWRGGAATRNGKGERLPVNIEHSYEVPAKVSVRNERFGGLVYRYDNRALLFLHSRPLVDFLRELDGERPLGVALEEFAAERGMDEGQRQALENALGQLEGKGIIREL